MEDSYLYFSPCQKRLKTLSQFKMTVGLMLQRVMKIWFLFYIYFVSSNCYKFLNDSSFLLYVQGLTADVEICFVDFTVTLTSTTVHMITKQKLQQKSEKRIQLLWLKKFREYKLLLVKRLIICFYFNIP